MSLPSPFISYFKTILCINLDSRPDRWRETLLECNREGFTPERLRACTPDEAVENSTFVAFNTSQRKALEEVWKRDLYPALILEDDCVFKNTMHLNYAMNEFPPDWEVLYLGCNLLGSDQMVFRPPLRHSAHLFKLQDAWMTQSMVYSKLGVEKILDIFDVKGGFNYDEMLRQFIIPDGKSFIIAPQITYQRPGKSDIWGSDGDYSSLFERGNKLLR